MTPSDSNAGARITRRNSVIWLGATALSFQAGVGKLFADSGPAPVSLLRSTPPSQLDAFVDGAIWRWSTGDYASRTREPNVVASCAVAASLGAWVRQSAAPRPFEEFLQPTHSTTDDVSAAILRAADWSAKAAAPVVFTGNYSIAACAMIVIPDVWFVFADARFDIADNGPPGRFSNNATGQVGLLCQQAHGIRLGGAALFAGRGTPRLTSLAGVVLDSCRSAQVGDFAFDNMAAGRIVAWCDDGVFGDIRASRMAGRQTFGQGTAGSADVVLGCRRSSFGNVSASDVHKPVRYCSVAVAADGRRVDNEDCRFGTIAASTAAQPEESSLLAVRSARDCTFAHVSGTGFSQGLYLVRYPGDEQWSVDGNQFAGVSGVFPQTAASVDSILSVDAPGTTPVGRNSIESVSGDAGGEFGIFINSGDTRIDRAVIEGAPTRCLMFSDCKLEVGQLTASGQREEAVLFGLGAEARFGAVDVQSGSVDGAAAAIRFDDKLGSGAPGDITFDHIRYRYNARGKDYRYVIASSAQSPSIMHAASIDGRGSSGASAPSRR